MQKQMTNGIEEGLFLSITSLTLSLNRILYTRNSSDLFLALYSVSFLFCLYSFSEMIFSKPEAHLRQLNPLEVFIRKLKLFNVK